MKHDHKKTKKLKVALFAMVMFLPFIAIGVTCATHIFNKEVTEETETATINYMYETNEVNNTSDFVQNNIYKITIYNTMDNLDFLKVTKVNWITNWDNYNIYYDAYLDSDFEIYTSFTKLQTTLNNFLYDYTYNPLEDTSAIIRISTYDIPQNTTIEATFIYNTATIWPNNFELSNSNHKIEQCPIENIPIRSVDITTNPQDQTTNIFYDSCSQVEQSFILNWCEQANPVRGPIQSFTTAFSLPNEHIINTLITYWICIAMIYIVIDIIVECVIMITHFFNKEF